MDDAHSDGFSTGDRFLKERLENSLFSMLLGSVRKADENPSVLLLDHGQISHLFSFPNRRVTELPSAQVLDFNLLNVNILEIFVGDLFEGNAIKNFVELGLSGLGGNFLQDNA